MKRFLLSVLIISFSLINIFSQELGIRVLLLPVRTGGSVTEETVILANELLRVSLVQSGSFTMIEDMSELSNNKNLSDDLIAGAGTRVKADFVISAFLSDEDGPNTITFNAKLIEVATARTLLQTKLDSELKMLDKNTLKFGQQLSTSLVAITYGATIDNVKRLYDMKKYSEASVKLSATTSRNPLQVGLSDWRFKINSRLAEEALKSAEEKQKTLKETGDKRVLVLDDIKSLCEEALFLAGDAKENEAFRDKCSAFIKEKVLPEYASDLEQKKLLLLATAKVLLQDGNTDSAVALVEDFLLTEGSGVLDDRIANVLKEANTIKVKQMLLLAKTAVKESDWYSAKSFSYKVLNLDPLNREGLVINDLAGRELRKQADTNRANEGIGPDTFSYAGRNDYSLCLSATALFFPNGTLEFPVTGAHLGSVLDLRFYQIVREPIKYFYEIKGSYAQADSSSVILGYNSDFASSLANLGIGAGFLIAWNKITAAVALDINGVALAYKGDFSKEGAIVKSIDTLVFGAAIDWNIAFEYHFIKGIAANITGSGSNAFLFGPGFVKWGSLNMGVLFAF